MNVFWHRRDLRIDDNAGLYQALKSLANVQPIFIFDKNILNKLEDNSDARVSFIHQEVERLKKEYNSLGSDLLVFYDSPEIVFRELMQNGLSNVYANKDYEPYAIKRDKEIYDLLVEQGGNFSAYKDHVIFEKNEVLKNDGSPYTVFTPYSKKWKQKLNDFFVQSYPSVDCAKNLVKSGKSDELITLGEMGFERTGIPLPPIAIDESLIKDYSHTRDIPSINGTSRLGMHLRFGTISIRRLTRKALKYNETYLNELIWRDFYQTIIYHFPDSAQNEFKSKYNRIQWEFNQDHFDAWCNGVTGYPLVDAGMRELNETGFMHNRVRMLTASFLTKHLLHDWRLGEAYFARKLLDYDLAANVGGWQWAAGTGCDAAPYFRVFSPDAQQKKFDPEFKYIRKWVPEYNDPNLYPKPIIEHKFARERAIARYKEGLSNSF